MLNCCCSSACRRGSGAAAIANVVGVSLDVSNFDSLVCKDCAGCKGVAVAILSVGKCGAVNLCNGGVLVVCRIESYGERGFVSEGNGLFRCVKRIACAFRNCYRVSVLRNAYRSNAFNIGSVYCDGICLGITGSCSGEVFVSSVSIFNTNLWI